MRNAQEHLGLGQLILFFVAGVGLGFVDNRHPWLLGFTAVSLLPVAAVVEVGVDPSSHTLLPFELVFYGAYGALVAGGVVTSRCFTKSGTPP